MSAGKPTSKLSINDYYLCPSITGVEVGAQKPTFTSVREISPNNTKDKVIKEGLGDYLPNIPGNLNSPGPEDWSLQYLIANPPRGDMELSFFSGAQFMGFILKEGEPIPDHLRMEPSSSGTGGERVKKKHKNKKHKANQHSSLNHLLDKIPPDTSTTATHGDAKLDPLYEGEVSRKKDKKSKKAKKGKKDEKKKKKLRYKDDDDRPDKVPSHLIQPFHTQPLK